MEMRLRRPSDFRHPFEHGAILSQRTAEKLVIIGSLCLAPDAKFRAVFQERPGGLRGRRRPGD